MSSRDEAIVELAKHLNDDFDIQYGDIEPGEACVAYATECVDLVIEKLLAGLDHVHAPAVVQEEPSGPVVDISTWEPRYRVQCSICLYWFTPWLPNYERAYEQGHQIAKQEIRRASIGGKSTI